MDSLSATNCLQRLAGEWIGQETLADSKWGIGGVAVATISARLDFNSKFLIQDYAAQRHGKPWMQAHAVFFGPQEADGQYGLFWFDSLGFTPTQPAMGQWDGHSLSFTRVSPRGQTRHEYRFVNDKLYCLKLESSFDNGASWQPVLEGAYQRKA